MADESTVTTTGAGESTQASQTTDTAASTHASTETQTEPKATNWEELIQKAVDRATHKLGNDNKKLREENERLKKANLSEAELRQVEQQEREKELAERERQLLEKENRFLAIKAIKEIGLDDGSDASLALVDFVMGEDEETIKERVKVFDALVKRIVQSKVDGVFKSNGRAPAKGSSVSQETDPKNDSVAVRIGKNAAMANKAVQSTLDYYTGGKKK